MDIVLRNCGAVGWLGLLMIDGKEIYRTGNHHRTKLLALGAVEDWIEVNN